MINLVVFAAGMTTLAIELTASRLLGPTFGTSNLVWATVISLILVYLTAGYFLGGRLADRWPSPASFYRLAAWGAFTAGLVPFAAAPVLERLAGAVETAQSGVLFGSAATIFILFSLPVTLLGCVSPYAIRLALKETRRAGSTAGQVYALSTLGSIVGTFLPVLFMIPLLGTARTFLAFSLSLLTVSLAGLLLVDRVGVIRYLWMPPLLIGLGSFALPGSPTTSSGDEPSHPSECCVVGEIAENAASQFVSWTQDGQDR